MVRECARLFILASLCPGCSLVLDFSDGAAPHDAMADTPYTQAECDFMEPNDSLASPATVTAADTGPAAICAATPEDHDFYKFTVAGSAPVTIAITFTNRAGGDLDMKLYDSTGTVVSRSSGFGNGETITCPGQSPACGMLSAGDYVFEVFPAVAGSVNNYTFSITGI
ncbi:MAG: hypothetical protein HOV81_09430 [Kofleriaceae bacterium]|nr:hypothetical protein [Kofleriaceae bacterium]